MPFTEECCECGCPWEGYKTIERADEWRMKNWVAALRDPYHVDHGFAWERLQDYMKDRWMEILEDFFEEAKAAASSCEVQDGASLGGDARIPHTASEMVDMVLQDNPIDFFACESCSDNTDGSRCYRNHPNPKKRRRRG